MPIVAHIVRERVSAVSCELNIEPFVWYNVVSGSKDEIYSLERDHARLTR